jgi:hypothetical protein
MLFTAPFRYALMPRLLSLGVPASLQKAMGGVAQFGLQMRGTRHWQAPVCCPRYQFPWPLGEAFAAMHGPELLYLTSNPWVGVRPMRRRDFFTLLGGDASRSDHHVCGPP